MAEKGRPPSDFITRMVCQALAEMSDQPPTAVVDWIAQVVDPQRPSAIVLLCDEETKLAALAHAKDMYKLLRVVGRTSALRRMGRRMYAATIAAAIAHHDVRISAQSDAALGRAFHYLTNDDDVPQPIRDVVRRAAARLPHVRRPDQLMPGMEDLLPLEIGAPSSTAAPRSIPPISTARGGTRARARRELRRMDKRIVRRAFDPIYGSSFQRERAYCPACRSVVEIRRRLPNRTLHRWVVLLTLGLWLPVWGALELAARFHSWRCVNCRRRIYQAMLS